MTSEVKPLKLYRTGPTTNPVKVWFVLEELGVPYELVEVAGSDVKKEPFISLNPNGRVPALVDPNKNITLWEASPTHEISTALSCILTKSPSPGRLSITS